ncbi:hypothetical protein [Deinococcus ruber]|uniref:EF-hand domain-containing protein n=1 Tax=Deinococcus ruber TaxID=1848197 RepID=A0A918FEW5_9DEIO|nr:hypothetical protein [Deinococcus ruber]GGR30978.1 hypothetical protein GCM10008957_47150 [Deinococcus ruber]
MIRSTVRHSIALKRLAAAAVLLSPLASAQTSSQTPQWDIGNGNMRFLGCYAVQRAVQCDIVYTLIRAKAGLLALEQGDLTYITADGRDGEAQSVSVGGAAFGPTSQQDSLNGKPQRATFRLPIPASSKPLKTLNIVGHVLSNITISHSGAPALPKATPAAAPVPSTPQNAAAPAGQSGSATISGTISAGDELQGAVVFACVRQGDGCDNSTIKYTEIRSSGQNAAYTIVGLDRALTYTVVGWLDTDGDGEVNAGDLLGTYNVGSNAAPISPPHTSTDFSISEIQD